MATAPGQPPNLVTELAVSKQEVRRPVPKKGGSELHMIWTDSPCRITCWNHGHKTQIAMRNPRIETIVAQHPWFENDCLYADIVLPANTFMEVDDILTNNRQGTQQPNIMIADKAIEPIGESKSDAEIVLEVSKKFEDFVMFILARKPSLPG